jgi:prolycopene isomerase
MTLQDFMDDHFADPELQALFACLWDFHGLPPSRLSAIYYAMNIGDILKHGACCILERSKGLSHSLAGVIQDHGGTLLLGSPVRTILTRNTKVTGVELENGKQLPARTVVSNASPLTAFNRLLKREDVPRKYSQSLNAYRPSLSTFIVWAGLSGRVSVQDDPSGLHVLSGLDPEADYQNCLQGEISKVPFRISLFGSTGRKGPLQARSTLRLFCLCGFEPWRRFEQDYFAGNKSAYEQQKKTWTRILISRAEKILGPLGSITEIIDSSTPLTNLRFTGNPRGAVYGFEQTVDNAVYHRVDHRTPIQGLYLASAWCRPGGGFSGALMTGELAFRKIVEDWSLGR